MVSYSKHRLNGGINLLIWLSAKRWFLSKTSNYSLWDFYFSCTGGDSLTKLRLCLLFLIDLLSASPETQICIEKWMKVVHPVGPSLISSSFFFVVYIDDVPILKWSRHDKDVLRGNSEAWLENCRALIGLGLWAPTSLSCSDEWPGLGGSGGGVCPSLVASNDEEE